MRTLGLDYGERRIGVAMSDLFGWTAQGLEVIDRKAVGDPEARVAELVELHDVAAVVVGLPKNMNGSIGPSGENCIAFAESLRQKLTVPVSLWDERLTTVTAERTLLEADVSRRKRKQVIDKMAAAILLQSYLDSVAKRGNVHDGNQP
ncbi:Holliday junction resolvase RuvX [Paenibacillaceae bacterium WGS1546]|uniref:Holliday junction resolvase RuvX n=1 Tax=Cohnella sp. WGS1546 TaxID=3366810 RepID=UPI00372D2FD1